jgi:hypothetical protein
MYVCIFLDVADRGILIAKCVVTYDRDDGFHNNLKLVAYMPAQNHFKPYELHFGTHCDYPGSRSALFSGNIDFLINPVFFSDFQKRYTAHIEPHVRSSTP